MKGIKSDPYLKMYWTPLIINVTNSRRVVTIPIWTKTFNLHSYTYLTRKVSRPIDIERKVIPGLSVLSNSHVKFPIVEYQGPVMINI